MRTKTNTLKGGRADHRDPESFDLFELARGILHEREHTDNPRIAREIAMDHLAEDPHYYSRLEQLEASARRRKKAAKKKTKKRARVTRRRWRR